MKVYMFAEARRKLAILLDEALRDGAVRIQRHDGAEFEISPVHRKGSPLDVPGVPLDLTAEEIVSVLRETRERAWY
jgi:antitoxin Phd